jgi:hypothetical protein
VTVGREDIRKVDEASKYLGSPPSSISDSHPLGEDEALPSVIIDSARPGGAEDEDI